MLDKHYFPYAFFEGNTVETEKATVSIMTNALQYGTGMFGGIRGYYDEELGSISLFRVRDHYARFLNSCKILGVSIPYSADELFDITVQLVEKNAPKQDAYLRPFGYAHQTVLSPNLANTKEFEFALYMIPLGDYIDTSDGLKVCVSSWTRISDTMIPARAKITGGYINSALARKEAHDRGFDEAIFLNTAGHVCEGTAENVYIVRNGVLITPSESEDILEGITRRTVLEIARNKGIEIVERAIDRSELYVADEAFFSGTGAQVAWIREIDGRKIGDGTKGEITSVIGDAYFRIVKGKDEKYADYCTKISNEK